MAGLTGCVLPNRSWDQQLNLTDFVPEHLLLELVECCCESQWTEIKRSPFPYYLFFNFRFEPSTPEMRRRAITAFSQLAESLGDTTPAKYLRRWITTASVPRI
jgi:hypothetical protein